jgi:hypothetical protein
MMTGTPLTAEMMADAFGYFWNAALRHQHATVEANMVEGFQAIATRLQEFANEAQEKKMKILLGCLGDPQSDMRIGFTNGQWVLATGEGDSYEALVVHENWDQFVVLIHDNGYSDYVEGE